MNRNAGVVQAVVLAATAGGWFAPDARAATPEDDARKQIKAMFKEQLAEGLATHATQTANFLAAMDALQAAVLDGSEISADIPPDLVAEIIDPMTQSFRASFLALRDIDLNMSLILQTEGVEVPNDLLAGGGGEADKAAAKLDAAHLKLFKKFAARVKKFLAAANKARSDVYRVTALVIPLPPINTVTAKKGVSFPPPLLPSGLLAAAGGSPILAGNGVASVGGMTAETKQLSVSLGFDTSTVVGTAEDTWQKTTTGLNPSTPQGISVVDPSGESRFFNGGIGVPAVP